MATIKEMAERTFPIDKSKGQGFVYMIQSNIIAYMIGALDVLEEVERTISVSEEGWLESNLRKLIKELKE